MHLGVTFRVYPILQHTQSKGDGRVRFVADSHVAVSFNHNVNMTIRPLPVPWRLLPNPHIVDDVVSSPHQTSE